MSRFEYDETFTEERLAQLPVVAANITARGKAREAAAKARHAAHFDTGASFVGGFKAEEDYVVYLDDNRGDRAAMSIEFGTVGTPQRSEDGSWSATGTVGTFTLTGVPLDVGGGDVDG